MLYCILNTSNIQGYYHNAIGIRMHCLLLNLDDYDPVASMKQTKKSSKYQNQASLNLFFFN